MITKKRNLLLITILSIFLLTGCKFNPNPPKNNTTYQIDNYMVYPEFNIDITNEKNLKESLFENKHLFRESYFLSPHKESKDQSLSNKLLYYFDTAKNEMFHITKDTETNETLESYMKRLPYVNQIVTYKDNKIVPKDENQTTYSKTFTAQLPSTIDKIENNQPVYTHWQLNVTYTNEKLTAIVTSDTGIEMTVTND